MKKQDAARIYSVLLKRYPDTRDSPAKIARGTPFETIILTILSAQTTDKAVLLVQGPLFLRYPNAPALAAADISDVEKIIHSLGFFHAKARHIIDAAKMIATEYGGVVPDTMDGLLTIPGVGRKTANIVLYHAYGRNVGIAVDTHVRRLAQRIGFSDTDNVSIIERDLMALFPEKDWGDLTDVLIAHGRATCTAKKPHCSTCPIIKFCRYYRTVFTSGPRPDF
jgi:endonuclease-3